jgi:hypothetical protein
MTLLGDLLIPSIPASNQYQVVYYQSTPNRKHKEMPAVFVFEGELSADKGRKNLSLVFGKLESTVRPSSDFLDRLLSPTISPHR